MAGYIGTTPVPQATQHRESFTATGGQTSFATAGYTPQFIDVYLNGVKLAPADYTATNGSDVVLASGATASDILEIVAYTPFEVANQTFTGDTSVTNLAVTGTFTSRGIDDNADTVAITIDSSENVGIGVTPSAWSTFNALEMSNGVYLGSYTGGTTAGYLGTNNYFNGSNFIYKNSDFATRYQQVDGKHQWFTAPSGTAGNSISFSQAMTLDASGNLLVGKTSTGIGTAGIQAEATGQLNVTKSGDAAVRAIRLSSDGDIVKFYKDTTTVGSIGTTGDRLYAGTGDTGLFFNDQLDSIDPWNTSTNAARDAAIDLGDASRRFKDLYLSGGVKWTEGQVEINSGRLLQRSTGDASGLRFDGSGYTPFKNGSVADGTVDLGYSSGRYNNLYLSGGVYLGGVVGANKLDDYEEGTWTPTLPNGGTISVSRATYTKIGRFVHVQFQVDVTPTNNSSQFRIGGLPFVTASGTSSYSVGSLGYSGGLDVSGWHQPIVQHNGGDYLYFQLSTASTADVLNSAFAGSTRNFLISANYETN